MQYENVQVGWSREGGAHQQLPRFDGAPSRATINLPLLEGQRLRLTVQGRWAPPFNLLTWHKWTEIDWVVPPPTHPSSASPSPSGHWHTPAVTSIGYPEYFSATHRGHSGHIAVFGRTVTGALGWMYSNDNGATFGTLENLADESTGFPGRPVQRIVSMSYIAAATG